MNKLNVLVTGCGGDIGQSIGKILKSEPQFNKLIGCDIHVQHAGVYVYDKCFIVSKVNEDSYFEEVNNLIMLYDIDILIVTSEPELRFITNYDCKKLYKCKIVIIPNREALEIGFDKYRTVNFLIQNNLPAPQTYMIGDFKRELELPVIVKDRFGAGSKGVMYIDNFEELVFYKEKLPNYIVQEFLSPTEGEFTCGVFRNGNNLRSIIFKRNLLGGFSSYGEVVNSIIIDNLLKKIAELIKLDGSINIQLRMIKGVPYIFEINPRFSSTVLFRHLMGFKDVIWSIEAKTNKEISVYNPPQANSRFYKGFSEFVELEQ